MKRVVLFVTALIFLGGCATLQNLVSVQKPKINIAGAKITSADMESVYVRVNLSVENPNAIDLRLTKFISGIFLNNSHITDISVDKAYTLKAGSTDKLPIDVAVPYSAIPDLFNLILSDKKEVPISFQNKITFESPLPLVVPINFSINIPIPKIPELKITSPEVKNISFTNIDFAANLSINNKSSISIKNCKLEGYFYIQGRQAISVDQKIEARKSATSNQPITFSVSTIDLGISLVSAIKSGNYTVSFKGNFITPFGSRKIAF